LAVDAQVAPGARLLGSDLGRPGQVAGGGEATTTAALPAWSVSKVIRERPFWTRTSATVQPAGISCMQGTSAADGTDWAISHSGSPLLQPMSVVYREVLTRSVRSLQTMANGSPTSRSPASSANPTRRMLQRWIETGWGRWGSRSRNSACRSRPRSRSRWRSCEGMASPRVAANPSLISWAENWRRARR
jgi:hypothetical protein